MLTLEERIRIYPSTRAYVRQGKRSAPLCLLQQPAVIRGDTVARPLQSRGVRWHSHRLLLDVLQDALEIHLKELSPWLRRGVVEQIIQRWHELGLLSTGLVSGFGLWFGVGSAQIGAFSKSFLHLGSHESFCRTRHTLSWTARPAFLPQSASRHRCRKSRQLHACRIGAETGRMAALCLERRRWQGPPGSAPTPGHPGPGTAACPPQHLRCKALYESEPRRRRGHPGKGEWGNSTTNLHLVG